MIKQDDINTLKCGMVKNTLSYIRSLLYGIDCKLGDFLTKALLLHNYHHMAEKAGICPLDIQTKRDIIECVNEVNKTIINNPCNNC